MSAPQSTPADAPPRIAVYERRISAAEGRVWENVRDWEHLPWLHHESFRSIERLDSGDWGWLARIGLPPAGVEIELELRIDDSAGRYVARTRQGPGVGSEIWTAVRPADSDHTDIEVGFHVPGISDAATAGAAFVQLYERLWDQDEAMMQVRTRELARLRQAREAPATPLELGTLAGLRSRLPLTVDWGRERMRVVEVDGELVVHSAICPHWRGPLDAVAVADGCIRCPWHGDRFDVRTGMSANGRGLRLAPAPALEIDASGHVRLLPARPR